MNTLYKKQATRFSLIKGAIAALMAVTLLAGCASYGKLEGYREQYAGSDEFF